ncbi:hypothetical protein ATT74_25555 [Salmonella enterica subsp. enterica serovar Panama]|uniref:Uncharacterized protein n=1 Tax=Salmonella enterica subsp. enterica serovar Panama TaxID=29472 RepID=A0A619ALR8_SALET|nr:hypothetical protein [Salmonella enterica subsp. enterica serovar Amager]EBW4032413.1 hypothetical protein [Salmonella enterica subsp. enterica serovar Newport]ECI8026936.1 hypothetical protein [Salmonella enterica subsp. enterica serovar Ramatgan]ECT5252951.1 hypothetical protein [Salmonella enterica subsp. enterica serovar Panama]EGU5384043.1 hypothetical protein [Salmonella enterica]
MKVYLQRYGVAGFLLVYWSLSFVNEYFLHEQPLSAESWKWMRLQALLVTGSVVVTVLRLFLLNSAVRREATAIMTGVAAGLHVFALLVPSVWLFYQWQWNGLFLLQWQGAVFLFCLFALPVSTFCFS